MASPSLAPLLFAALAFATLPTVQAQEVLDPEPRECGPIVLTLGVDSGCTFWACHSDDTLRGCQPGGCPGHEDCEQVVCDVYVETPFLLACFHGEETAALRCLVERPGDLCLGA